MYETFRVVRRLHSAILTADIFECHICSKDVAHVYLPVAKTLSQDMFAA